jgi:hypothetical protein
MQAVQAKLNISIHQHVQQHWQEIEAQSVKLSALVFPMEQAAGSV